MTPINSLSDGGDFDTRLAAEAVDDVELGLDRMRTALRLEGLESPSFDTVLVAGTNGKGETAAHISGILQAHGCRVGLFTSPHLVELRERWRIDGRPVTSSAVRDIGEPLLAEYGERGPPGHPSLTYFEMTALMAGALFESARVDIAVLEVGLGGRLDATNAFPADLAVITTIGYDHADLLGDSIEEIAEEKCGILREGVPTVVGRQMHADARDKIRLELTDQPSRFYGEDNQTKEGAEVLSSPRDRGLLEDLNEGPSRWNRHAALQAAVLQLDDSFDLDVASEGLTRTQWAGRRELRRLELPDGTSTDAVLDTAHNREAVDSLAEFLDREAISVGAILFGGLADKSFGELFDPEPDAPPIWGALVDSDRSFDESELRRLLPSGRLQSVGRVADQLTGATEGARRRGGRLLVFGSTYLVGEVYRLLEIDADDLVTYGD